MTGTEKADSSRTEDYSAEQPLRGDGDSDQGAQRGRNRILKARVYICARLKKKGMATASAFVSIHKSGNGPGSIDNTRAERQGSDV